MSVNTPTDFNLRTENSQKVVRVIIRLYAQRRWL